MKNGIMVVDGEKYFSGEAVIDLLIEVASKSLGKKRALRKAKAEVMADVKADEKAKEVSSLPKKSARRGRKPYTPEQKAAKAAERAMKQAQEKVKVAA